MRWRDWTISAAVIAFVMLGLFGDVKACPNKDACAAYDRGDYATAYRLWRPLAEQGDVGAQNYLGFMHGTGQGVAQDYVEAVKWYSKAAAQGYAPAQNALGVMYKNGLGIAEDYAEAVRWYRQAAEQDDASAQYTLGELYKNGFGIAQDYVEAHKWLNIAAANGHTKAATLRNHMERELMTAAQIAEAQRLEHAWQHERAAAR